MSSSSSPSRLDSLFVKEFFQDFGKAQLSKAKEMDISTFRNNCLKAFHFVFSYAATFIDFLNAAQDLAHQHGLTESFPIVFGLMLCFFGGHYLMLVTITETVRLFCWKELVASVKTLRINYEIAMRSSLKDDLIDADGNNIPDFQEMNSQDLILRKIKVFMKSVDVAEVRSAIRTLATAYFSTIAALRLMLARYLALALSSARAISENIPLERVLAQRLPPEAQKWSGILSDILLNVVCMILTLFIGVYVGSLNCAIRGSHMFVKNVVMFGQKKGLLEHDMHPRDPKSKVLMIIVAVTGFLWQISHRNGLPFPFNVLLFPLTFLEWWLQFMVSGLLLLTPTINFS